MIRAKAACLRHEQGTDPDAAQDARGLLDTAARRLRRATPRMVLVGGPPGSGTSTLARELADRVGASVFASDPLRKQLAGLDPHAPAPDRATDLYSDAHTDRTYDELLRRAGAELALGTPVVLDATWTRAAHRDRAARVAESSGAELVALRCAVDPDTAARRVGDRGPGTSDADPGLARRLAARADDWPQAHVVSTADSPAEAVDRAMAVLEPRPG